jgi:hypothetical protein
LINVSCFRKLNNTIIYNYWNNDFKIIRDGNFAQLFVTQAEHESIDINNSVVVFDCCNEGIGPNEVKLAIDSLSSAGIKIDIRVLFNVLVTKELPYTYMCFPGHFVAHCNFVNHVKQLDTNWQDLTITRYFIVLMRRASVGRAQLAKQLLDNFNHTNFLLSCGSEPNEWAPNLPSLVKAISPYKLPILLDGVTGDHKDQHYHTHTDFFACFFNLVVESSSQTDEESWNEIFITEKSLKPFAYRQVPVWFAVPGTVQAVRDLGFDVYDDIIDHSYDTEQDPFLRMEKVITVLQDFINIYDLKGMQEWRRGLWARINKNVDLLYNLADKHHLTKHNIMAELTK